MAYSDTVQAFKDALAGYSEEEKKLSELYKNALSLNERSKSDRLNQLDADYKSDRNDAFADNARDEQNTLRSLSARGLGFSGEMAQARLNSNMSLSNRLGDLAKANTKNRQELINEHEKYAHDLSVEEAERRASLAEGKNKLLADIADHEQRENAQKLDRELEYAKLEAEKEMQDAELKAKYPDTYTGSFNGNGGNGGNTGNNGGAHGGAHGGEVDGKVEGEAVFSPEIKPKDLAKLTVMNATGGDYIKTENDAYLVNKYLLEMQENYNLSDEYMQELIFMLKAYGHKEQTPAELKKSVVTRDAKLLYDSAYGTRYKECVDRGAKPNVARIYAQKLALNDVFDLIYSRTSNSKEFLEYCAAIKLNEEKAKAYAYNTVWYKEEEKEKPQNQKKPTARPSNTQNTIK